MAEFTKTERGARSLHVNGYHYTLNKRGRNGNTYWRCVDRRCAGRATLDSNDVVVSENNNHSHAPNPLQVEVSKAVDKLKDQAAATAAPMASVYRDTLVEILQDPNAAAVAPLLPTLHSLQSALYRKRRKRLPPMPATIDDVTLSGEWAKTIAGDPFYLYGEDNIHLLATPENIRLLAEAEDLYMDGTFKIAPRLFHQVFTVHAFQHGRQFPLLYCLLPGQTRQVYSTCLSILVDAFDQLSLQPQVKRVVADFELAIHQAVAENFSGVSVKG